MYNPGPPPADQAGYAQYLQTELMKISRALNDPQDLLRLRESAVAPSRIADAMVVYADGTNLVLGPGEDLYVRINSLWRKPGRLNLTSKSAAYTFVATDADGGFLHPSADTTARTWTIPANSSVPYEVGTTLTMVNQGSAGVLTIAITTDTLKFSPSGSTGSRTLAANGIATVIKVTSTEWIISGSGLT